MGRALLVSVTLGGLGGGLARPRRRVRWCRCLIYERGTLPLGVLLDARQLAIFARVPADLRRARARREPPAGEVRDDDLAARGVGARLRVGSDERVDCASASCRSSRIVLGSYVLFGWIFDFAISDLPRMAWFRIGDRLLDFLGLPLFLYGVATLLASKRERIQHVMAPVLMPIGGVLGPFRAAAHVGEAASHRRVPADRRADVQRQPVSDRDEPIVRGQGGPRREGADRHRLAGAVQRARLDRRRSAERAGRRPRSRRSSRRSTSCSPRCGGSTACATRPTWSSPCFRRFYLPGYGLRGVPLFLLANPDDVPRGRLRRAERRAERDVRRHPGAHEPRGRRGVAAGGGLLAA